MAMNHVKPWEEERVGPGLGQGFTTEGSGGFNSGMESRNSWLPKNVNELRTLTNPKVTYGLNGHEGPADSYIKDRGSLGVVDKIIEEKGKFHYLFIKDLSRLIYSQLNQHKCNEIYVDTVSTLLPTKNY